jgi:hypothetical protein
MPKEQSELSRAIALALLRIVTPFGTIYFPPPKEKK